MRDANSFDFCIRFTLELKEFDYERDVDFKQKEDASDVHL